MKRSFFHRAALRYAELGFPTFPAKPGGKEPLCKHGESEASTDPAQIREWSARWPDANVAIAPGKCGLFVVDVDTRHFGDETLCALPPLPDTATTLSGGGGFHFWFRRPPELDGIKCSALRVDGIAKSGIDIKGVCSGYVIAPPSIHPSGRRYLWEASSRVDEVEIAEAPLWLVRMIKESGRRNITHTPRAVPVDPESFALGVMFKRAGLLGQQFKPGVFAVRCPNEAAHTSQSGESSTVIFAPEKPGGRGTFYCSHTSECSEVFR